MPKFHTLKLWEQTNKYKLLTRDVRSSHISDVFVIPGIPENSVKISYLELVQNSIENANNGKLSNSDHLSEIQNGGQWGTVKDLEQR